MSPSSVLENRMENLERDVAEIRGDMREIREDLKTILAAHNAGRGVISTFKVGAAVIGTGSAIAALFHYLWGGQ